MASLPQREGDKATEPTLKNLPTNGKWSDGMLDKYLDGRGEKWENWVEKFITVGWVRKQLDAGDFLFYAHDERSVGLEIKSVPDLTGRLGDARRELAQLIDTVDIPIFLIWGRWNRQSNDLLLGGQNQLTWGHLWSLLQTFQDSGLRLQIATSRDHAFLRINQLFAYYQKPEHTSSLVARRSGTDRRVASLMPIPGVSKKLGGSLVRHFASLRSLANAPQSELVKVPLIGSTKSRVIEDWFTREQPFL